MNTSPITPEKLSDYRNGGDVFVIHAHDLESVIGQLMSPVPLFSARVLNGCRKARGKRLQQLMEALESTPDATFGVQQPEIRFDVPEEDLFKQISESGARSSSSTTYISQDGFMLTREDVHPSSQKFVVAGSTVSKADLFSVIGHVKWMADINSLTDRVDDLLWEMLAKVRHAKGAEKRVGQSVRPMAEYPDEDRIEWESARWHA